MKKLILIFLTCLLTGIDAMAQIWYYIPAGESAESFNGIVWIVIKNNDGGTWKHAIWANAIRQNLLKDNNYYINAFNNSDYVENLDFSPKGNSGGGFINWDVFKPKEKYNTDIRKSKKYSIQFDRLAFAQKETKCTVYKDTYISTLYAFSLDFKTMIIDPDKVNPSYYTSCSVKNFIVRKSIDDLF